MCKRSKARTKTGWKKGDKLQQLDRHCQSSAQQVYELLAKQNQLMQERNTLTEEMQSLHTERRVNTVST
ncbi:Serologically defined colon cancer antigen 8 [Liparis tanakae]|uniref:Serologically defined colon cancer antigen 8 n=1 Tax=Liparis tanakae TaxID=230148 RepID=A0A4Z2IAQ2_9TELE|nr:Serologically defined colon cancer antigen 8 [Liparis tanakae]